MVSGIGVDVVTWGGLDLKQDPCCCEKSMFARPMAWRLSLLGECYNVDCGFYNSVVDPPPPVSLPTSALEQLLVKAEHLLSHIPLMRLVAYAEPGLHFDRKDQNLRASCIYVNPIGASWRANYVGRILPAAMGSKHSARGDDMTVSGHELKSRSG